MVKAYKAAVQLDLNGVTLTSDYPAGNPIFFVSKASCDATLPYLTRDIGDELGSRLGHKRFKVKLSTVPA